MSKEELIEKLTDDPAVVAAASAIKDPAAMIAFAKEKGVEITEAEAKEAISVLEQSEGELGSDALRAVSGGKKRC